MESMNRDFFRMVEILKTRTDYEDILYENKVRVHKSISKLDSNSAPLIVKHFMQNKSDVSLKVMVLVSWYKTLISNEPLEVA